MSITRRDFLEATALGAALTGAPGLRRSVAAAAARGPGTCAAFGLPPVRQRAMFRWWWPGGYITPEEIEREVNAMADAGFGGFEIADVRDGLTVPMDPKLYGWGTARWVAGVERALEVAYRRGMKADITIGAHWPKRCTGIIALVRLVMTRSSNVGSILKSSGRISMKTGLAPRREIAPAVAKKVNGTVTTSSPALTPNAINASSKASLPEATPTACVLLT